MLRRLFHLAVTACSLTALGQQQPSPGESRRAPVIVDVKPSPYPQLAFAAHVSGVVTIDLAVRHDGTLQSADVIGGPAMLRQAALGAVQQARFECHGCGEAPTRTHVSVQYTLSEVRPCPATEASSTAFIEKESYLQITHSDDAISITDRPIGTCDYAMTISKSRARSVRCLFLWHCA